VIWSFEAIWGSMTVEYRKKGEISSLTGLRGVAALLVIVHHYVIWTAVVPVAALPPWLILWTATPGMGMAIFLPSVAM
jgi:peptidoglycan/LPS O-acetylase OafA/YrhL